MTSLLFPAFWRSIFLWRNVAISSSFWILVNSSLSSVSLLRILVFNFLIWSSFCTIIYINLVNCSVESRNWSSRYNPTISQELVSSYIFPDWLYQCGIYLGLPLVILVHKSSLVVPRCWDPLICRWLDLWINFIDHEYLFSPIRCVAFVKHLSFVITYPDFITNLEFGLRWQLLHIAI